MRSQTERSSDLRHRKQARLCGAASAAALMLALALAGGAQAQSAASDFTSGTRYDAMGRVTGTIAPDPDGSGGLHHAAVRNTYDAAGRVTKVEKGELSSWQSESVAPASWSGFTIHQQIDTSYDAMGRKLKEVVSSGGTPYAATQYSYDAIGRLDCTALRMNPAIYASLPSSACTLGTAGSHGPDRITKNVYDAAGQVLKVQKAYATALQQDYATYTYSNNGKQTSVTDANGNKASMTFDGHDSQVKWNFPSPTTAGTVSTTDYEEYAYDAAGNRTSLRKRDGRTFTFTYDAHNRVTSKVVPDACVSGYACTNVAASATRDVYYGYDLRGLQTAARFDSASGADGVTSAYDGFGRQTSSTTAMGGVSRTLSYGWYADGNRWFVAHPDGVMFTKSYDGLGREVYSWEYASASAAPAVVNSFTYNAAGQRASRLFGQESYGYDAIGRASSYTQDLVGTGGDLTTGYSWSPASQMTGYTRSNHAYAFSDYASVSRSYTTNGLNQYATVGGNNYGYDSNGNLTADGTIAYTYDAENRLVATSAGANLTYDPLGRLYRVTGALTDTRFLYDGDALVAEYDSAGNVTRRYMHSAGTDEPLTSYQGASVGDAARSYLYADHQGSIIAVANAWSNPMAINSYDDYGIPGWGNSGRFQYTGQAWIPELGMYHYKARVYSPTLGRFLQTDPIGYDDQVNLYAYVGNDPVNGRDSTGLCGLCKWVVKAVVKGGRIAEDVAGIVADASTIISSDATLLERGGAVLSIASEIVSPVSVRDGKAIVKAVKPYVRPSGATTRAQRAAVQGKACVKCGDNTGRQVAGHKKPLVEEHYETGSIDKSRMRSVDAVQPECRTCSAREGADASRYSRRMRDEIRKKEDD